MQNELFISSWMLPLHSHLHGHGRTTRADEAVGRFALLGFTRLRSVGRWWMSGCRQPSMALDRHDMNWKNALVLT